MSLPQAPENVPAAASEHAGIDGRTEPVGLERDSLDRQALAAAYAACALSTGASLAFFVSGVAPLPVLLYFPLARRVGFQTQLGELSMDYYGRSLVALLTGAVLALFVYLLCSSPPPPERSPDAVGTQLVRPPVPRLRDRLALCAAYVVTAVVLAAGLFAYQLAARVPTPEPFPTAAQAPRI